MNRIYKVIYSKARQCYIVVSELAKSNHKSSQQGADHTNTPALARIIAVRLAAGALTWGSGAGRSAGQQIKISWIKGRELLPMISVQPMTGRISLSARMQKSLSAVVHRKPCFLLVKKYMKVSSVCIFTIIIMLNRICRKALQ